MPVKFGPEGYTGPGIRRYQAHQPPDGAIENARGAASSNRRARVLGLVLTIAVIVAMLAYLGRPANSTSEYIAVGKVLAKESIAAPGGGTRHVLRVTVKLPGGAEHIAVVECGNETWQKFRPGDKVLVRYAIGTARNRITVLGVESAAPAIEF